MIHESQWGVAPAEAIEWDKLELSDPSLEPAGVRHITVKTEHLYGRADITLSVPEESNQGGLPLVILLHGVYGSHWAWNYKGGAQQTHQRLMAEGAIPPCILAMPSDGLWGDGTGYLRHQHRDYGGWIARDVPAVVRKLYPATQDASLHIAGLSMGGFGALWLGGLYGNSVFESAFGLSSVTNLADLWGFTKEASSSWKLGAGTDVTVLELLRLRRAALPRLAFCCGSEDALVESNRQLSQGLKQSGIGHFYEEQPGAHTWDYWRQQLPSTLTFLLDNARD
jgi:putative tributyrin esterase